MADTFETGYSSYLTAKLTASATTITVATPPTRTAGRMLLKKGNTKEWISFTGVSGNNLTGVTRGLSKTGIPATGSSGIEWVAGTQIVLVAMHDQLPDKQNQNTWNGQNTFTDINFSGTGSSGLRVKNLTTTERDAYTANNGDVIYNTTTNEFNIYQGGSWFVVSSGSTQPNASETVAGKVEEATQTETDAGTSTGGTGAKLFVTPEKLQQGLTNKLATEAEAIAGSSTSKLITPATLISAVYQFLGVFGDGRDGDVVINIGTTTLTSDMYYNNLTVNSPGILNTNGYRVYVKGTLSGNGTIQHVGNNGGDALASTAGVAGTVGAAGAAPNAGTLGAFVAGQAGAAGRVTSAGAGNAGTAGTSVNPAYTTTSGAVGGAGGTAGSAGGAGGTAGTATRGALYNVFPNIVTLFHPASSQTVNSTQYKTTGGSGSGGSGAIQDTDATSTSGSGGGSGSCGGMVWISAYIMNFVGIMSVVGGNGGNGGAAYPGGGGRRAGGGGGGAGGNGGVVYLISTLFTSIGTTTLTGGTGGTGGAGNSASNGASGSNGNSGTLIQITL